MQQETILTQAGLDALKRELEELTTIRRPEISQRILEARELGDLKENGEYHAAKEAQGYLETRIMVIEESIRTARVVEKVDGDTVGVGSRVEVTHDDGEREQYVITGATESDADLNRVSYRSPIGAALVGARPGQTVSVTLPRGTMTLKVESVSADA